MNYDIWNWGLQLISTTSVLSIGAIALREPISNFFSKSMESHFEKKLEKFRAEIRNSEAEINEIRSFLVSARRERDTALNLKKMDAAELLLKRRLKAEKFMMLAEYLKILNIEELIKLIDDKNTTEFINTLIDPFNIDEQFKDITSCDLSLPSLYLSDKTIKYYGVFEALMFCAAMTMKLLSLNISDKPNILNASGLSQRIIEIVPNSKEGFDKFGESFSFHWAKYFFDETLNSLRHEVAGTDDLTRDAKSIEKAALDTRQAYMNLQLSLQKSGLPSTLINKV